MCARGRISNAQTALRTALRRQSSPIFTEGFELIQLAGGTFNEAQYQRDILKNG